MTKLEAIELERKCDELMCECLHTDCCSVSMALTGKLKVEFNGDYITLTDDYSDASYINFSGFYYDLKDCINAIVRCVEANMAMFDELMWSYKNISSLEE